MNEKELKENINKIKDLLQSNNYESGFELLKTFNEPKLNENLADLILSKVENEYLPSFGKSSNAEEGFNILYLLIPDVVKLEVKSCALQNVDSISKLTGLTNLSISNCKSLQNVDGIANLTSLTSLKIFACKTLQNVDGIANLTNLNSLHLDIRSDQNCLKNLNFISRLTNLTSLDLYYCDSLQNVDSISKLTGLTSLNLSVCKSLQDIGGLVNLPNLTKLNLSNCISLENIYVIAKLINLSDLNLAYSENVEIKPSDGYMANRNEVAKYQEKISILKAIKDDDVNLLSNYKNITNLDLSFTKFRNIKIPSFLSLTSLSLSENYELESVAGLDKLTSLTELNLKNTPKLTKFDIKILMELPDWATNKYLRLAASKNPSLPEKYLLELLNDENINIKTASFTNSSCSMDILEKGSNDTENYASSRIRRSVALNISTPKNIINKLLEDEYRWVREAASSHKSVKGKKIPDLVQNGDRYILEGLLENPNCTDGIKSDIAKKLEDENKYPVETDTYIIENWGCGEYTGGSMTVDEMADAIVESDGSSMPGEYYEYDDLYHCFGDYDLKEEILLPDGTNEKLNLTLETDITDCGADFVMCATSSESGEVGNYEIELEELFDTSKVMATEEYGLVEGYEYDGDYFEGESEGESTPGDGYSLPSLHIQVKAGDDSYETFYIEDEFVELEENGVDVSDAKAVLKFLKEKYNL